MNEKIENQSSPNTLASSTNSNTMSENENNTGFDFNCQCVQKYEDIPMDSSSFKLFYANMQSTCSIDKFNEIKCIVFNWTKTIHVLLLVETWFKSEEEAERYQIPGYTHVPNIRIKTEGGKKWGGGVSIFIQNSLKSNYNVILNEFDENSNHYLWLRVHITKDLPLNIVNVYKREGPDKFNDFLEKYSGHLMDLQQKPRENAVTFGDFNTDLLTETKLAQQYLQKIQDTGFEVVNKIDSEHSTRDTDKRKTLIDHVCTNVKNHRFNMSIINSCLSDHKHIFLEILGMAPQPQYYSVLDLITQSSNIKNAEYLNKYNDYEYLEQFINEQNDKSKIDKEIQYPVSNWVNKDTNDAINTRNIVYAQTKIKEDKIKEQANVVSSIITHKKQHFYKLFEDNKDNTNKIWKLIYLLSCESVANSGYETLKLITNLNAKNIISKIKNPPRIKLNSGPIKEGNGICDYFNSVFSSIGKDLANKIPNYYHEYTNIIEVSEDKTFRNFIQCSTIDVTKIIDELDDSIPTGLSAISVKTIKSLKDILAKRIADIINTSLFNGVYPDKLKVAVVRLIYNLRDSMKPSNYRPQTVFPPMSKIYEQVVYNQLNNFLIEQKFFKHAQYYVSRHKISAKYTVIDQVTKIYKHIDKKNTNFAIGININIYKIFDAVSHKKLLQKLSNVGVKGTALNWFESYLQNRCQIVKIGNYESTSQSVTYGIPQGSILAPLFLDILTNDIHKIGINGHPTVSVRDTCLFYFGNSFDNIQNNIQEDLNILSDFFKCNLLTIIPSQTSYTIFTAKNKHISDFTLTINGENIKKADYINYLGLFIDSTLMWKPHIDQVNDKLKQLYKIVSPKEIAEFIPFSIYNTLVEKIFYVIEIWGSAANTHIKELQRTLDKLIKLLGKEETKPFNLRQMYIYSICICIKNIDIKTIQSNLKLSKVGNTHNLRNENDFKLKNTRTNYGKRAISFAGVQSYNKLPYEIKQCNDLKLFESELKKHVLTLNIE